MGVIFAIADDRLCSRGPCCLRFSWLFLVELSLDILFSVFTFAAAVAVAAKCQENAGTKEQARILLLGVFKAMLMAATGLS